MDPAIDINGLSKTYRIYARPRDRLLERLPGARRRHRRIDALRDITLSIPRGECLGLVGLNGAGKSTLLRILAGTTVPSAGSFALRGKLGTLVDLGAGLHREFSARDNIHMCLSIAGATRREARALAPSILEFAELTDRAEDALRTWSSGMIARLGFSMAVARDPDVLLIDEVLSVGDAHFRRKCSDRIFELVRRGTTIVLCSHMLYDVQKLCQRAVWLKDGRTRMHGPALEVTNMYFASEMKIPAAEQVQPWDSVPPPSRQRPDRPRILDIAVVDSCTGSPVTDVDVGAPLVVRAHIENGNIRRELDLVISVTRVDGVVCFAPSSKRAGTTLDFREGLVSLELDELPLLPGSFIVQAWLLDASSGECFDRARAPQELFVHSPRQELGLFYQPREWRTEVIEPPPRSASDARG